MLYNGDLGVILDRGRTDESRHVPTSAENGRVLILLGVDHDHDMVQYDFQNLGGEDVNSRAVEALEACKDALVRVRNA